MRIWYAVLAAGLVALAPIQALADDSDIKPMTAAQTAQYRVEYKAAKEKWAAMSAQEKSASIASAKTKRIADLTATERVGQNNDIQRETAAQSGALKAEADAAKASWAKMTADQKKAATRASWKKKRAG